MKRIWLSLSVVMVFAAACTGEAFPLLIPYAEEPAQGLTEEYPSRGYTLFDLGSSLEVTVISPRKMTEDYWLFNWAEESVRRDSLESNLRRLVPWSEKIRWIYGNGFVASERRCVEGREELADLIETHAAMLRQMRSDDISHFRMAVARTIWQTLPEGNANCSAYLSELPIGDFMPVVVDNVLQYAFGR